MNQPENKHSYHTEIQYVFHCYNCGNVWFKSYWQEHWRAECPICEMVAAIEEEK